MKMIVLAAAAMVGSSASAALTVIDLNATVTKGGITYYDGGTVRGTEDLTGKAMGVRSRAFEFRPGKYAVSADFLFNPPPINIYTFGAFGEEGFSSLRQDDESVTLQFRRNSTSDNLNSGQVLITGIKDEAGGISEWRGNVQWLFVHDYGAADFWRFNYQFTAPGGAFAFNGSRNTVPEPASWAMMIFGMGMAGAALRRKTTPAVLA